VYNGKILDYDEVGKILTEMMNSELKCGFAEQRLMISEPPNNSIENR
jgi:hypothetical protein